MTRLLACLLLCCLAGIGGARAQDGVRVGVTEIRIDDPAGRRGLEAAVWYPTSSTAEPALVGDSLVFKGSRAVRDGDLRPGRFPLVVLSHGLGGSPGNLGWLGARLAGEGMVAVAVAHPGTTRGDMPTPETRRPWERPRDISRTIAFLLGSSRFAPSLDLARIAVVGHSLGGNSALAVAGARFDVDRFVRDCEAYPGDRDCRWFLDKAIDRDPAVVAQIQQSLRDERVAAVVTLDAGLAQAFTADSLAAVKVPVLLIESVRRVAGRPVGQYSRYLAATLPAGTTTLREIADARHFSFTTECKPGAIEVMRADRSGDEFVCVDGGGRDRAALHAEIFDMIRQFLRVAGI